MTSLSIIIPALNEEDYIEQTIHSVQTSIQDRAAYEIIIVDNGSTDKTLQIVQSLGIKVISKPDYTVAGLRNYGAEMAVGDILVFIDADILLTEEWMEPLPRVQKMLQDNPNIITGSRCGISDDAGWLEKNWFKPLLRGDLSYMNSGHLIISKTLFNKINGFDSSLITDEDSDLCIRAARAGATIKNIPELKVIHQRYPATLPAFFKREVWHGKGQCQQGLFSSKTGTATSIFLLLHLITLISFCFKTIMLPLISTVLILSLCLLSAVLKYRNNTITVILTNVFLFYIYYLARSVSIIASCFSTGKLLVKTDHSSCSRNPIRILQLIAPTSFAGAERVVLNLAENIQDDRFQTTLALFLSSKIKKNIFITELEKKAIPYELILMEGAFDVDNLSTLTSIIRDRQIDIIHSHGYRSDILGFICAKRTGIKIVSTIHGWTPTTRRVRLYEKISRFFLPMFDHIIAVSSAIKNDLRFIPEKKISLLQNAINTDRAMRIPGEREAFRNKHNIPQRAIVIGTVARLSREKGIKFLIEAMTELAREKEDIVLLIVGRGKETENLQQAARQSGVEQNIIFYGFEKNPSLIYRNLDIFILPSLTEGTPMALLEAMCHEVPVIATRVGEIPNIIEDKQNGLLINRESARDIAEAVRFLLADRATAAQIAENGRQTVCRYYSLENWLDKIKAIYAGLST